MSTARERQKVLRRQAILHAGDVRGRDPACGSRRSDALTGSTADKKQENPWAKPSVRDAGSPKLWQLAALPESLPERGILMSCRRTRCSWKTWSGGMDVSSDYRPECGAERSISAPSPPLH
jgi:hypothetical protein